MNITRKMTQAFVRAADDFRFASARVRCQHEVWRIVRIDDDLTTYMRCTRCGTPWVQAVANGHTSSSFGEPVQGRYLP